ncbi:MAG: sigma factor-like helix-turn-helix DNA-binding protein [Planctomycetota bacterium]
MPPLPRFKIDAVADLANQLRFAPKSALVRDLERTEALAFTLDADGEFPLDYVVFRVTGYRSEQREGMDTIPGGVLLGELATLAEHLSAAAKIDLASLDGALAADELCERWSVSRKTLERYRKRGLLSRRVVGPGGKPRVAYTPAAVEAFERREPSTIQAASRFTRLEPELREQVLREAIEQARSGKSLNQAALAIAERIGRGHETVRQILRQREQDRPEPIFEGSGPLGPRERRVCYRAWRRAVEPGAIADRVGKPRSSVLRVTTDERAAVLRELLPEIARGLHDEAPDEVALERLDRAPQIGLGGPELLEDLLALARGIRPIAAAEERVWLAACRELRRRAVGAIEALPEHGNASPVIDQIETDLRWSARLKAELVRAQLPTMLRAIESRLASSAEDLGTTMLRRAFGAAIRAGSDAIDAVHPSDRGRLAAPVSLAVDRRVRETVAPPARAAAPGRPGKARRKIGADAEISDFTAVVYRWQRAVEPDPRIRSALAALDEREATILRRRFGYAPSDAGRPITLAELAEAMGSKPLHVARSERAAVRRAIEAARRADTMVA